MLLLLLICRTHVLFGNHMNNYYQAMSLLLMSPVTETVSFMHASPNSRIVWLLPLKKQVLIRGIIFWITSFFMVPIFIHFATLPTAPWRPFYSLRFAHSWSSLWVIFSVKSSSLEVFEQLSFLTFPCQSSTWAPCLYVMGQLPLFICLTPPLLTNLLLLPPFLTFLLVHLFVFVYILSIFCCWLCNLLVY